MTIEQLKAAGALYFESVLEGLDTCDYRIERLSCQEAYNQISAVWCEEQRSGSMGYADFYYYQLDSVAQGKVEEQLSEEEKQYLREKQPQEGQLIFPLDHMLLSIITKLNASQMLFSTDYFIKAQMTWWGNFNQEYVIFYRR